jgi:multiple sugar transport system ATP-binding protein
MATLSISRIRKSFGPVEVLKDISIELEDGGFLVLLGPSGCGKSTLLSIIAGLESSSGGDIVIGERNVNDVHPKDRNIAMVFQSYALYPTMLVERNVGFGLEMRKVPVEARRIAVEKAAQLLQIEHLLDRKPGQLSGGQRQRVAMGRAIVRDPDLFLFDEPLSNLDAKLRVEMRTEIKRLHDRLGTTIVYVTHDQIEAMTLGTRIVVLNQGVIQQIGTPTEIYERPANLFVADFMGSPPMNLIPATHAGGKVSFAGGGELPARSGLRSGDVVVGIRPEAFTPALGEAQLRLKALSVENAGSDTFASFTLGGKTITTRLPGKTKIAVGDEVALAVDLDSVSYFDPETQLRIE